jgi:erythromycin esterase
MPQSAKAVDFSDRPLLQSANRIQVTACPARTGVSASNGTRVRTEPQMRTKRKRLLVAGVLALGLMPMLLWLAGVRLRHIRFLLSYSSAPAELSGEQTAALHAWLRENAVPLQTVAAGSGFDDMQPLKGVIGDARIVALGEAAHGNRQFNQAKHRMVEFLVEEMSFRVVAIEATFAGALELNDYILTGNGTPEEALAALVYPAWRNEAVLDMVKWMRRYNVTHEEKVRFYGFDNKPATGSAVAVCDYLRRTNGTRDYDQLLSALTTLCITPRSWGGPSEKLRDAAGQVRSLIAHLERQRPASARPSAGQELRDWNQWRLAVQHARVLLQNVEFLSASSISEATDLRDKSMARNVCWLAEYEEGARIILWAANPHVTTTPFSGSMGDYLRRRYGNDLVSVGLLCNRESSADKDAELSPENTDPGAAAPKGCLEALLAEAGLEIAVLDLRFLPKGAVSAYFHTPRQMANSVTTVLPWAYDVILFIESTTNARPVR